MNNIRFAWRNLQKDRFYSLLNVGGLALAIAASLLIIHYARFEYSYENVHEKAEHIYRVTLDLYRGGEYVTTDAETYPAAAPELKLRIPEIVDYARMENLKMNEVSDGENKAFLIDKIFAADPAVFSIFNFQFIQGNKQTVLRGATDAVITETIAEKFFGNRNVLGQTLKIRGHIVTIRGVIRDVPENTHLKINVLLPFSFIEKFGHKVDSWTGNNNYLYLQLSPGVDLTAFNQKLRKFSEEKLKNEVFTAEPIKKIHLYSHKEFEPEINGDARTVNFLLVIASLILLTGSINYVNLTTARSVERSKEGAIRKVLGSSRLSLIQQFLAESLLINILSFVLALIIIKIAAPIYLNLVDKPSNTSIFSDAGFWIMSIGLFVFNCLLSGLYPAFVLSAVKPVSVTNRSFTNTPKGSWLRKALVVSQFSVAIIVLAAALIIYQQLVYLRSQQIGMDIKQTLVVRCAGGEWDSLSLRHRMAFKDELLGIPGIKKVAWAGSVPGLDKGFMNTNNAITRMGDEMHAGFNYYHYVIDADFIPVLGITMVAGRNFFPGSENKHDVIINEEAAHLLGFPSAAAAIGEKITLQSDNSKYHTIVGVMKNYRQRSWKEAQMPMIHSYDENPPYGYYLLKMDGGNIRADLTAVEKTWQSYFSGHPFDYYFMDEMYDRQYKADIRFGKIVSIFSAFTVFITCLGLLGLTAYNVSRRTKEIGIRKVLGASVAGIVQLLTKDFVKLILIAIIIATPLCWWSMNRWLDGFANRITIQWWIFAGIGILAILIAVLTVSFQSMKAALTDPVKSLRTE
ncbi:ABC transporter permease [Chitinophaga silvisoli]|uniref:ABC transporter permease n=1 Tax=Chitinophaga silvisoli TaxID=2291814 RepID=A0A3E1NU64_9BACT|nr:ABC transporter permease [Chitinophaga silvisoli]RFM31460.1 ABC transporter permease [Chitinophaga silvisoli]